MASHFPAFYDAPPIVRRMDRDLTDLSYQVRALQIVLGKLHPEASPAVLSAYATELRRADAARYADETLYSIPSPLLDRMSATQCDTCASVGAWHVHRLADTMPGSYEAACLACKGTVQIRP